MNWAGGEGIYFTRGRPYTKNDQATIESKNNHLVRNQAFYYRYDTAAERTVLNRLWPLVGDQFNFLKPTKKPIGWGTGTVGHRTCIYDQPATPLERLLRSGVLRAPDMVPEWVWRQGRGFDGVAQLEVGAGVAGVGVGGLPLVSRIELTMSQRKAVTKKGGGRLARLGGARILMGWWS